MSSNPLPEPRFLVAFSYAGEQDALVRPVAEAVRAELGDGLVFCHHWFGAWTAGYGGDVRLQALYRSGCRVAVQCLSADYGRKGWTLTERDAIGARLLNARNTGDDAELYAILPIRFADGDVEGVLETTLWPDARQLGTEATARLIVERLRIVERKLAARAAAAAAALPPPAPSGWPEQAPQLEWPEVADHSEARAAFAAMLARGSTRRLVLIQGGSDVGKSHLTRQMEANALAVPDLAVGRLDFKGTTDIDSALRAFVQILGVGLPAPGRLSDRLAALLGDLRRSARPTLLIFDTYEAAAGEAQDWLQGQLLRLLVRAEWLRVVVAGQHVPDSRGGIWAAVAHPTITLRPPRPEDWLEFGRRHRPDLDDGFVRKVCEYAGDKPSVLAGVFGAKG